MLVIWDAQEVDFNVCARKKSVKKKQIRNFGGANTLFKY